MDTEQLRQRLDYLEAANDTLQIQNRVLAAAWRGLLRGLPADLAQDVAESVQLAFEDEMAELDYENSPHTDLFHDCAYALFRHKR